MSPLEIKIKNIRLLFFLSAASSTSRMITGDLQNQRTKRNLQAQTRDMPCTITRCQRKPRTFPSSRMPRLCHLYASA
jgi:hypothetical protein